jgi:N-methylhydantoinase A/oxoprolinase/acetone carboxylase beta subunit
MHLFNLCLHQYRIFGKSEREPLDIEASRSAFEKLTDQINTAPGHDKKLSVEEIAFGFIKIANEAMCRPIRAITEAKGVSLPKHVLSCFGGAGGQHSCGSEWCENITMVLCLTTPWAFHSRPGARHRHRLNPQVSELRINSESHC